MKNKRTIITILLCVVLAMSVLTLVACDDNDHDMKDDDNAPFFIDITKEQFETAFDNVIGYVLSLNDLEKNNQCGILGKLGISVFDNSSKYINCMGYLEISHSQGNIKFIYYNSEENALTALPFWEKYIENENKVNYVKQDGKVICISEENVFEIIQHSTIPKEKMNESTNFIYDSLLKELHDISNLSLSIDGYIRNGQLVNFGISAESKTSNNTKEYRQTSCNALIEDGENITKITTDLTNAIELGYYTNDSYCKIVGINGIEYVEYYLHENKTTEY